MKVSRAALSDFARAFVGGLTVAIQKKAYVIGLKGELGAGKTTFVQEVAKALGVPHIVTSPTFVVVRTYAIHRAPFTHLIHIDAYRLDPAESDTVGFGEYAKNPKNLILAEWPERLPRSPAVDKSLEFRVVSENVRDVTEI